MNNMFILMLVAVAGSSDRSAPPRDGIRYHVPDSLTGMILQYAMCRGEARAKLVSDPTLGLARLYHENRFVEQPGVEVTGAGNAHVNGWYRKTKQVSWSPSWVTRPRFEKDNGYLIAFSNEWFCLDADMIPHYHAKSEYVHPNFRDWEHDRQRPEDLP